MVEPASSPTPAGPGILAPVDGPHEVAPLAEAGATELYGGVWAPDGEPGLSATQRTFASAHFADEAALRTAIRTARSLGLGFHLTLNAPLYAPQRLESLLALADRAAGWGATGVIAADPGLLAALADRQRGPMLTLSTLGGALNAEAFRFFERYGISRAVLPRHLTLEEVRAVCRGVPGVEFEAFVLVGACPNEESLCTFQHVSPSKRWPCEISYRLTDGAGEPLPADHPLVRWYRQWGETDRRLGCGLCAVPRWVEAGVRHLKIVGRGGPTAQKAANVALVAAVLRGEVAEVPRAYRERFGRPCHRLVCYARELWSGRPAS